MLDIGCFIGVVIVGIVFRKEKKKQQIPQTHPLLEVPRKCIKDKTHRWEILMN